MSNTQQQPSRTGISKSEMDLLKDHLSGTELTSQQERTVHRILNTKTTFNDVIELQKKLDEYQEDMNHQFMERFWVLGELIKRHAGVTDEDFEQVQQEYNEYLRQAIQDVRENMEKEDRNSKEE